MSVSLWSVLDFVTCNQFNFAHQQNTSFGRKVAEPTMSVAAITAFLDTVPSKLNAPLSELEQIGRTLVLADKSLGNDPQHEPLVQRMQSAFTRVIFAQNWAKGKIQIQSGKLVCADEISTTAKDPFFLKLCQHSSLQHVTYCDFSKFPQITHRSIQTMIQACPKLEPASFKGIFARPELCDSSIVVHNVEIPVNKAVLCQYSTFFAAAFSSESQTSQPLKTLDKVSAHPVRDCFDALVHTYDLSLETDIVRVLDVLNIALILQIPSVVDKAQKQAIYLFNNCDDDTAIQVICMIHVAIQCIGSDKLPELNKCLNEFLETFSDKVYKQKTLDQQISYTLNLLGKLPLFPFDRFCTIPPQTVFPDNKCSLADAYGKYYSELLERPELRWQSFFLQGISYLTSWTDRPKDYEKARGFFEKCFKLHPSIHEQFEKHVVAKLAHDYLQGTYILAGNMLVNHHWHKFKNPSRDEMAANAAFVLDKTVQFLEALQKVMPHGLVLQEKPLLGGHKDHSIVKEIQHKLTDLALMTLFEQAGAKKSENDFDLFFQKEATEQMPFPRAYYHQHEILEHIAHPNAGRFMLMALFQLAPWKDKAADMPQAKTYFEQALKLEPGIGERYVMQKLLENPDTKAFAQQFESTDTLFRDV